MNKSQILNTLIVVVALFAGYRLGKSPGSVMPTPAPLILADVEQANSMTEAVPTMMTAEPTVSQTSKCGIPATWVAYRIQATDTLASLVAATGLDSHQLLCANGLPTPNVYVGQIIYLPSELISPLQAAQETATDTNAPGTVAVATHNPDLNTSSIANSETSGSASTTEPTLPVPPFTPTALPEVPLLTVPLSGTLPLPTPTRFWMLQASAPSSNQQMAPVQATTEPTLSAPAPTLATSNEPPLPAPIPREVTPVDPFVLPKAPAVGQNMLVDPSAVVPIVPATAAPAPTQQSKAVATSVPTKPAKKDALPVNAPEKAQSP